MACVRNLIIGILKLDGHDNIAAAGRHHARDATRTLATLGLQPGRYCLARVISAGRPK